MKALLLEEKNQYPVLREVQNPGAASDYELIKLKAAALNHRDVWIMKGKYPGIKYPVILGSDGAGLLNGREVVVNPGIGWGGDERCQGREFQILGLPTDGTFAEYLTVGKNQIFDKPAHLSFEEAAALPLAGLTAYRVLFSRCDAQPGEKVLITGAGGGVAVLCCLFAVAVGLEVYVTSGSTSKIERAVELGAKGGVNYKEVDWPEKIGKMAGGFDLVIDSAGGEGFSELVKLCKPGGRIGIYGGRLWYLP